jgi:two-component system, chemotaxis family, response regulator Rcp1
MKPALQRRILLVEDSPADAALAKIVHDEVKHCSWLDVVYDGREAIRYLRGEGPYADKSRPGLVLMDVGLPMKSGVQLIGEIRSLPGCELLPIVIVSGSENPVTIREAYQMGANCVIQKSTTWADYFKKLESCYEFWCSVAELPPDVHAPRS